MGYFKIKLYSVCTFKYGDLLSEQINENWNHFSWLFYSFKEQSNSQISPKELLLTSYSLNPSIQFTMEKGIWMDHYHNSTDKQRCLPVASSHPNHC